MCLHIFVQGDTVEGLSDELKHIMETGYYQFSLHLTSDGVTGNVELLHQRSMYSSCEKGEEIKATMTRSTYMVEQKWNNEEINDFVRKLGFLDVKGEMGAKIDHFIYVNQV